MIRSTRKVLVLISSTFLFLPALVLAQGGTNACPQGAKFWQAQCEQGAKSIVCQAGMENLFRCVITETDVIQWKKNDGSFETTASLAALSNANLLTALCSQLAGPSPKTSRDTAESEYLTLLLNVCSGALPLDTQISKDGDVSSLINSFENALNSNVDLDQWRKIAEKVNKGSGLDAPACPDPESIFRNIPPC